MVLCGMGVAPRRLAGAERMLAGEVPDAGIIAAAAALAEQENAIADVMASEAYRRRLAGVLTRRALAGALARAKGGSV